MKNTLSHMHPIMVPHRSIQSVTMGAGSVPKSRFLASSDPSADHIPVLMELAQWWCQVRGVW